MNTFRWIQPLILLVLALSLTMTGCGGGGGESPSPTPTPTPVPILDRALYYSTTLFQESSANDGSISTTSTIILSNDTFAGANGDNWSSLVSNVPAGLSASLIRTSNNTAVLSFTGKATAHTSANNISNLTVVFTDSYFAGGSASQVSGAATRTLAIQFSDPAPVPPVSVSVLKGFWAGTQGTTATSAIVLANGEAWIVQQQSGATSRFSRSQLTPSSTAFSGSGIQYNLTTGANEPLSINGSYTEKALLAGTGNAASGAWNMSLSYDRRYETAARQSDAVGTWKGTYNNGSKIVTVAVAADGAITGSSSSGCSYNGVMEPRSADPAVFDLAFTERCMNSTVALTGIATVNEAKTAIFWGFTTTDKTAAGLFMGSK